jgi:polar amino acid transport system permease protein
VLHYHFNFGLIWQHFGMLGWGLVLSLELTVFASAVGTVLGLAMAVAHVSGGRIIRAAVAGYVECIRNIPLLLLVYLVFYGVPTVVNLQYSAMTSFVVTLSLYYAAYLVEVFRAGLLAVSRGLQDAGKAVGMTAWQRLLYVRLPVMFRIVLPSLSNTFVSLFKDTSVASVLAVPELTYGGQWINNNTFRVIEVFAVITPMYVVTGSAASSASTRYDERIRMTSLHVMLQAFPSLWRGLLVTLEVSALSISLALLAGLLFGTALAYGPMPLRLPIRAVVDVVRGIPVLVLIFFVYYVGPAAGLDLGSFDAAVFALSLFSACQVAEISRGAITSVHHGQMEAARAIGLTFPQCLLSVIFPQALRRFLPPWINSVTDTVKGSALVSLLGIVDLMLAIQQVIGRTYRPMPFYVLGALIYLVINYALSSASRRLEAHFAYVRD